MRQTEKGDTTDYVKRQYREFRKNRERDSCSHSIWFMRGMTFPLTFEVYKPKQRLLKDTYQSKPQIAAHMIRELK